VGLRDEGSGFGAAAASAARAEMPAAAPETPASNAMTTPSMAGPLVANPNPWNFDAGLFGKVYVTGVASGLGLAQLNTLSWYAFGGPRPIWRSRVRLS
jgi:hypothetical protein